jgi:hypothetical protein
MVDGRHVAFNDAQINPSGGGEHSRGQEDRDGLRVLNSSLEDSFPAAT